MQVEWGHLLDYYVTETLHFRPCRDHLYLHHTYHLQIAVNHLKVFVLIPYETYLKVAMNRGPYANGIKNIESAADYGWPFNFLEISCF